MGSYNFKSYFLLLFLYLTTLFLLVSCGDKACKTNTRVEVNIAFKVVLPSPEHDSLIKNLTVFGLGKENQLITDSASVSAISLPLNPGADTSNYIFEKDGVPNLLSLIYKREPFLVSVECGFVTRYHLKQVNINWPGVDSVIIMNPLVTNNNESLNISIYF